MIEKVDGIVEIQIIVKMENLHIYHLHRCLVGSIKKKTRAGMKMEIFRQIYPLKILGKYFYNNIM